MTGLRRLLPVLVLVAILFVGPGSVAGRPIFVGPPAPVARATVPSGLAPAPAPTLPRSADALLGSVAASWSLLNGSVTPGPPPSDAPSYQSSPFAMAVDRAQGTLWVASGDGDYQFYGQQASDEDVLVTNLTSGALVRVIPGSLYTTAIAAGGPYVILATADPANYSGQVRVYNASTDALVEPPIEVAEGLDAVTYDPFAGTIWVASDYESSIYGINASTGTVFDFDSGVGEQNFGGLGDNPDLLTYDPQNGYVYVGSVYGYNLTTLNGSTGDFIDPGPSAEGNPVGLCYDAGSNRVYQDAGSAIAVIDPTIQAWVATIALPFATGSIACPGNGQLLLTPSGETIGSPGSLYDYNASNGTLGALPGAMGYFDDAQAYDPATGVDYVSHYDTQEVTQLNTSSGSVGPPIALLSAPGSAVFDPADREVWLTDARVDAWNDSAVDALVALDPNSTQVVETVPLDTAPDGASWITVPSAIVYDPAADALVVANANGPNATELNATSGVVVSRDLPLGLEPLESGGYDEGCGASAGVYDPVTRELYFSNGTGGIVGLGAANLTPDFSTDLGTGDLSACTGNSPSPSTSLAVDPTSGELYDLPYDSGTLYGLDPTDGSVVSIPLGAPAGTFGDLLFDPAAGLVLVADPTAGTIVGLSPGLAAVGNLSIDAPDALAYDVAAGTVLLSGLDPNGTVVLYSQNASAPLANLSAPDLGVANGTDAITPVPTADATVLSSWANGTVEELSDRPKISAYTASLAALDVGVRVNLTVVAAGGAPPLTYAYSGLPAGCVSVDNASLSCLPRAAGTFAPSVTVTDAAGFPVNATLSLLVRPDPSVTLGTNVSVFRLDVPIRFSAGPANGTAPYNVSWSFSDGTSAYGLAVSHAFRRPGSYSVDVRLIDAFGISATASLPLRVAAPLNATSPMEGSGSTAGRNVTLEAGAVGGSAPYTFEWSFGDGTSLSTGADAGPGLNESIVSHDYATSGNYTVLVNITDAAGQATTELWAIAVAPAPAGSGSGSGGSGSTGGSNGTSHASNNSSTPATVTVRSAPPTPWGPELLVGADVVAALLVVAIVVWRLRTPTRPAPAARPAGELSSGGPGSGPS